MNILNKSWRDRQINADTAEGKSQDLAFDRQQAVLSPELRMLSQHRGLPGTSEFRSLTRLWQTPAALTQPCDCACSGYRASFLQGCGKEIHRQPRDSVVGGRWAAHREEGTNPRSQLITLGNEGGAPPDALVCPGLVSDSLNPQCLGPSPSTYLGSIGHARQCRPPTTATT